METRKTDIQKNMTSGEDRIQKIRTFCMSRTFMISVAVLAALFIALGAEVIGAVVIVLIISALLIVCDDVLTAMLPFMVLCIMVLQCYDSFSTFIQFIWIAPIPLAALLFHYLAYFKPFKADFSIWGILAVSVATVLGGIGTINPKEYFAPISLFYVVGLGFGMAAAYMLIKSQISNRKEYDIREKFIDIMYIAAILACFQVFEIYAECMIQDSRVFASDEVLYHPVNSYVFHNGMSFSDIFAFLLGKDNYYMVLRLQPGNNLSTFIMICMPFVFYRMAKGSKLHILTALLLGISLFLTKSRGGILCGGVEFIICLIFAAYLSDSRRWKWIFSTAAVAMSAAGAYILLGTGFLSRLGNIVNGTDSRIQLLKRSLEDFAENPLFGKGIGCLDNLDLYEGKKGTIIWYHMMIPQIIGSMGTVGILAYGWQFFTRVHLTVKKFSHYVLTFAMSYIGLFLMSQVNPGEFCPLPYGLIAVILFILIENEPDRVGKVKEKAR